MRVCLLAGLCLIGPLAERGVGSEPAGPAAKDADFPARLARGRKYLQAKQYGPAVVALARAVALRPGDPAALSELGWAAFLANDLAQAETVTAQALQATAVDSELRAATLYNKGRIDEARGRRERAIDAYKQSLTIRANTTVRQRLRALDAKAAAEFDPLRLPALRGSMANLKELAKEISSEAQVEVGEPLFLTPNAAFREGRVLTKQDEFLPQSSLALRTAKGWFYVNNFYLEEKEGGSHTSASQTSCTYEVAEPAGKVSILSCTGAGSPPASSRCQSPSSVRTTTAGRRPTWRRTGPCSRSSIAAASR